MIGVEFLGVMKNVLVIVVGIVEGLEFGNNVMVVFVV